MSSKITCVNCGKQWPHTNRYGHCAAEGCHETFVGLGAFDAHRVGKHGTPDRRCEIGEKHWQDEKGYWHTGKRLEAGEKGWWER
jgi:hypothetical protein